MDSRCKGCSDAKEQNVFGNVAYECACQNEETAEFINYTTKEVVPVLDCPKGKGYK